MQWDYIHTVIGHLLKMSSSLNIEEVTLALPLLHCVPENILGSQVMASDLSCV